MHKLVLLCSLLAFQPLLAQDTTNDPIVLAPESPQLHLVSKPPPIYPAIARAAHVEGTVSVRIKIGLDGHIVSAEIVSGPEMLRGAALSSLRQWSYSPILVDGKSVFASTTVAIPFELNAPSSQYAKPSPADVQDQKLRERLQPLEEACTRALAANAPPPQQVEACQKVADHADEFSANGFEDRRRAFSYLSTAFRRNKQLPEALATADKAVLAVQQGFESGALAASAYSVRAEAEAPLGKLKEASDDLAKAEENERGLIAHVFAPTPNGNFDKMHQTYAKSNYIPVLKSLLTYHAQILTALGRPTEAAAKMAEADKL